ncbi:aspartyl/asparaginyl beta-hydroxylase domain-containing protein [Piscinibacter terrae]|uniref:Aspartyl/asparaginyl beta-hydroxylase domain-containing protein n=1 Tax=Piscinibacter terrae TaxID=2496871 RepID=A0A3N7HKL4_9BURK|nr:aspartyl/asparaginyl beta-hydroxylase domain-containing protein [Albitalea terrae]RQP22624.1 aspartyl/asparaginyl beta-hydroxylase domain-containing protein [Albitalea terrae]
MNTTDSFQEAHRRAVWRRIAGIMKRGGYYQRVMSAGPELDRVKHFLQILDGSRPEEKSGGQDTAMLPVFPRLPHVPAYSEDDYPQFKEVAAKLRAAYPAILAEARGAGYKRYTFTEGIVGDGRWDMSVLFHMGEKVPSAASAPDTMAVVGSLPLAASGYCWSDVIFSAHEPKTHLLPHYSRDSFRIRCHLALRVPPGCRLQVADLTLKWEEGDVIFFSDSFLHETFNDSSEQRVVLIVDLWHPELTEVEQQAITAAFRKKEIRDWFLDIRCPEGGPFSSLRPYLIEQFRATDQDPLIRQYWN